MGWGASDGLVIDLAGMNRVTIDPATRTARIDAGSRQMQRPSLCDNREGFSFASTSIGVTRPLLPVSWAGPTTRVGC
jgi:hypothetical protein